MKSFIFFNSAAYFKKLLLYRWISVKANQPSQKMANSKSVEYNFLGNSGLKVSNICLGTMTFGKTSDAAGPFGIVSL